MSIGPSVNKEIAQQFLLDHAGIDVQPWTVSNIGSLGVSFETHPSLVHTERVFERLNATLQPRFSGRRIDGYTEIEWSLGHARFVRMEYNDQMFRLVLEDFGVAN